MWFEVLSTSNPLPVAQKNKIQSFMDSFPVSNVGESGTFLDLLYPFLLIFDGLTYDFLQLQNVLQDPAICFWSFSYSKSSLSAPKMESINL